MPPITKKTLEYLAELSRIELDKKNEEKLLEDLQKILGHFEELKSVDTENIEPMTGGTIEKNVFREDEIVEPDKPRIAEQSSLRGARGKENLEADLRGRLIDQFPEKENGFLKIPAVFE